MESEFFRFTAWRGYLFRELRSDRNYDCSESRDWRNHEQHDESNAEMSLQSEIARRKETPEPIRDGIDDLHKRLEDISVEMQVIKKMIEKQQKQT